MIFNDGYEYEVERDQQLEFLRPEKLQRARWDQGKVKGSAKRRKLDITPTKDYPIIESASESEELSDEESDTETVSI